MKNPSSNWLMNLLRKNSLFMQRCTCHKKRRIKSQKQLPRGMLSKSYSENMQQIYRRTSMPKCDFNKVARQLY